MIQLSEAVTQLSKKGVTSRLCVFMLCSHDDRAPFPRRQTHEPRHLLIGCDQRRNDKFDRAIIERVFKAVTVDQVGDHWYLRIGAGTMSVDDEPKITGISVNRPPSYEYFPEFWDAMFDVLRQTRTMLLWPAGGPRPYCCVANPAMTPDVPSNLIEALGEPAFVTSGAEIDAVMERSFS